MKSGDARRLVNGEWSPSNLQAQHSAATSVRQAAVVMASSGLHGAMVRLAGTPSEPLVHVDLLAVKEFVEGSTERHEEGVRMLDVRERREDVIRF